MNFMEKEKPVGVFDSGIGGLTVVKRIASVLPNESIVYFGDTARVPYGSKSNETVIEYAIQNAKLLMQKGVKAIVVACNTASSVALPELRKRFPVPIIEMIAPGAGLAIKLTKNKRVGVIGTRATISNKAYSQKLHTLLHDVTVFEKACPLFVPLVEEGWHDHPATEAIAHEYLDELLKTDIDTLILGCTHYPVLQKVISKVLGDHIQLIDSGVAAAEVVREELFIHNLLTNSNAMGRMDFFVSDIPSTFKQIAELFLGQEIKEVRKIEPEYLAGLTSTKE